MLTLNVDVLNNVIKGGDLKNWIKKIWPNYETHLRLKAQID